jgi:hypothetical protein
LSLFCTFLVSKRAFEWVNLCRYVKGQNSKAGLYKFANPVDPSRVKGAW